MKKGYIVLCFLAVCVNITAQQKADLIVYNAKVYCVDRSFSKAQAFAVSKGKIVAIGKDSEIKKRFSASENIDAKGKAVYPGFIDAHAHFMGYAGALRTADLFNTTTWEETLDRLKQFSTNHTDRWLIGRGWDQNKWPGKQFPNNQRLNELFPDRPVVLTRVDGHAVIANKKALEIAGIVPGQTIEGGQIETINGELTGILVDNAKGLINRKIPEPSDNEVKASIIKAQQNCFAFGLTTVDDCGLDYPAVEWLMRLQNMKDLKMRMYVMLSDNTRNYEYLFARGKIKTDNMHVCSFKVYADGALGSRGASLLEPYSDRKDWMGFLLSSQKHFDSVAKIIYQHGFQMCTHAIGDSGNRTILKIYAKYLKTKNDLRWRVEHAQVVNLNDFHYFGDYSIVPSVQPTHATSDMYWAVDRLGKTRLKGAYAYRDLLNENGWVPLGTDFPIEDISTFKTFYAAVARKDSKGFPAGGFQIENALTREQTLKGMTIWAAKSNFEEKEKGSIEVGKVADFVILDKDIMKVDLNEILSTKVVMTYLNGEKVYELK